MRASLAAFLGLAAAHIACGPIHPKPKIKPFPYDGVTATYPTGARLVAYELPHMPDVMVSASYRVGTVDDPPGKEGLAHLVEHLTFRARPGGGPRIWNRLDARGVEFNGLTSDDSTEFVAVAAPEEVEPLLRIEADRLRDPLAGLDEREFQREREVVLRELAERRAPGSDAAQLDWLLARALPGSPYARATTAESVHGLTLEDARAFVRAHYTPAHLMLVVTGPTPGAAVQRLALEALGPLARGDGGPAVRPVALAPAPFDLAAPVPQTLERRGAPVARPILWLAWTVPGDAAKGAPRAIAAADFMRLVVATASSGKNEDRVAAFETFSRRLDGVSLVVARVELHHADDAQRILDAFRAGRRYWGGTGGAALYGAAWRRDVLLMRAHLQLEALEVPEIARFIRTTGDPDYIGGWPKAVAVALSTESREYAGKYLRGDRVVSLLVVPDGSPAQVPARIPGAAPVADDERHDGSPDPDLAPGDPLRATRAPGLAGAIRRTLPNGLEVVVARRAGFRAVRAKLVVRGDAAGPERRLFEALAVSSRGEWIGGCGTAVRIGEDRIEFTVHGPTDLLEDAVESIGCVLRGKVNAPHFAEAIRRQAKLLERAAATPYDRARESLLAKLYPGHAYSAFATPATVRAFDSDDAAAFVASVLRPERATLLLTGDVEADEALFRLVERHCGDWKGSGRPSAIAPAPPPDAGNRSVVVVDRPGWETAELLVGLRVPPRSRRDEPAFRALAWTADHELNRILRLTKAATYGVSMDLLEQSLGSALVVGTVVDRRRAVGALATILEVLETRRAPLDAVTLQQARWQVARRLGREFGTTQRNSARLAEIFVHGLPPDEWETFAARTAALTPERVVAEAAAAGIGKEAIVLVGDAATLEPALRARGFAPEVLSAPAAAAR